MLLKNSNKFQKTRFWKEKSVKEVITLGPTAHATLSLDSLHFIIILQFRSWKADNLVHFQLPSNNPRK
jgi:hypothetical protein